MTTANEELRELLEEIKAFRTDICTTMRRFDERIAECEKALCGSRGVERLHDQTVDQYALVVFNSCKPAFVVLSLCCHCFLLLNSVKIS